MEASPPSQTPDVSRAGAKALRLLVVEDHDALSTSLKRFLTLLGHQPLFVNDVTSALLAARQKSFDVLLSDISLPEGTGWELLRQLRRSGHGPVCAIAMSGHSLDSHLCESATAGFDLHLIKPIVPAELASALNAVSV